MEIIEPNITQDEKKLPRLISIEGNIGVGKTTLMDNLELYYKINNVKNVKIMREPIDEWLSYVDSKDNENILTKFYNNPKKYSFLFQILILKTNLQVLQDFMESCHNCDLIICERSILSSRHVFTKMLYDGSYMDELEYKIYESLFDDWVNSEIFTPQKIVYLDVSPDISYSRIKKRSRTGEIVTSDYIISCGLYHKTWLENITDIEVMTLNCDNDVIYNLDDENNEGFQWINKIVNFSCV